LIGGLFVGVLSALPVINIANLCCCLWVVGGGVVAAYLARQDHPKALTVSEGATVGLLAGILGAVVWAVVSVPIQALVGPIQAELIDRAVANAHDLPPDIREWMTHVSVSARSMTVLSTLLGFVFMLAVGAVFSTVGGILGALFIGAGRPRTLSLEP
jgi:hypothetical protein